MEFCFGSRSNWLLSIFILLTFCQFSHTAGVDCFGKICSEFASCQWDGKGLLCVCQDGYTGDGLTCTSGDPCKNDPDPCESKHAEAKCVHEAEGKYKCICPSPYYTEDDTEICKDINECKEGTATCHSRASCWNLVGKGYMCICDVGYTGDGFTSCSDIDECRNGNHTCPSTSNCKNTAGTYECVCKEGYVADGKGNCADIDECAMGTDNCHENAVCNNTIGSFDCKCTIGYSGDGVRQCKEGVPCPDDQGLICSKYGECDVEYINGQVKPKCSCRNGFSGDGINCKDIDECTAYNISCHADATCVNSPGSYSCVCTAGLTRNGDTSYQALYLKMGTSHSRLPLDPGLNSR